MKTLAIGDPAPNFDLTSTEDVLLMLRDEVPRTALVLYFFADPAETRAREDLAALARGLRDLKETSASVLAVSPAKLEALKALQRELGLPFPLLTDDRGFSERYGLQAAEGEAQQTGLFVVDRRQVVRMAAVPAPVVTSHWGEIVQCLKAMGSPTSNLPRRVTNRLVDFWVNRSGGLRRKRA